MGDYYLSLDIGTSSIRAVLFDRSGYQKCIESIECPLISALDGKAEVDPDFVFEAAVTVIKSCVDKAGLQKNLISGIGMSCHMHSLMLVDREGRPLTKVMVWADTRSGEEAGYIASHYSPAELYYRTGCRTQHPMYPLSKLLWLKRNEPALFDRAWKFITVKEYILFRLYGEFVVDYTLASCQGYYNIHSQSWDDRILRDILGITEDSLSEVVECTHILKGFRQEYEQVLGISRDTPLVVGSGDGIMANIGCGVCDETAFSSTVGTSGAIRTAADRPLLDPGQRTWCYSFLKDMWVAGGAINNGGIALKWLRGEFREQFEKDAAPHKESVYKLFDRFAEEVPPGSEGLVFLPHLTGERCPDWNANARGIMFGLSYSHGRKHIVRAAMEGVIYRLYSVYEVLKELSDGASVIKANGGYTRSRVWLKIQADVFNKGIMVPEVTEASALGAAYTAMYALGEVKDIRTLLPGMAAREIIHPDEENHAVYKKVYELSKQIYGSIYNREANNE